MKRILRSPYLWVIVFVLAVVGYAYTARDRYRESAVLAGSQAPDFAYPSLKGEEMRLSDYYDDHVVLVNIWATWCVPCREEMPSMQRLYDELADENFEILAVSVDAAQGEVDASGYAGGDLKAFAHEYGLSFPILHDPSGRIRQQYRTTGVPESFVIAKGGTIYKKMAGPTEWDLPVNQELIRRLLDS